MVASLEDVEDEEAREESITAEWIRTGCEQLGVEFEVSPYAIEAVGSLIGLCQLAVRENLDVVFWWSL